MLHEKKSDIIIAAVVGTVFILSVLWVAFGRRADNVEELQYPVKLFGKNIININIIADEAEWNKMLDEKMSKQYIACDVEIDGKHFDKVGIRPKGNSSLTSTNGSRIGLRFDFDHYISKQTCYGLTKFVLNNMQADATYFKDYIAYDLMEYEGVAAPLHTFADVKLNGEPLGVYLAAEVYDEEYIKRVYKDSSVCLYSVKSSGFGAFENAVVDTDTCTVISSKGIEKSQNMQGMGPGGPPPGGGPGMPPPPPGQGMNNPSPGRDMPMQNDGNNMPPGPPPGMEGGGGDLVYTDDSTDSYKCIFANSVFDNTKAVDYARVIRAIKYLNKENVTKEELEAYWDVDEILRYLAVHTFMVNGDSYTGNMKQNYYIAEQSGVIRILPWDYNLSFGAFGGGPGGPPGFAGMSEETVNGIDKSSETVNFAIDTPVLEVSMEDRPLVGVLLGIDEYREKYHNYLRDLADYAGGEFIDKLNIVENDIYPYIANDATAFYSPDEHIKAFGVLQRFLALRCESIKGQLDGVIPSRSEEQNVDNIIISDISVDDMGSMGGPHEMDGKGGPPPAMRDNKNPQPNMGNMPPGGPQRPPGMGDARSNDKGNGLLIGVCLLAVAAVAALKLFKRNY